MTDLHCHILPGLDDGSESPAMSAEMARIAAAHGTDHIACTPHCQSDDPDLPARILRIAGIAGEIAEGRGTDITMIASDTVAALPDAVRRVRAEGQ